MSVGLSLIELMEFTEWERNKWYDWLQERRDTVLAISTGPNGDRFPNVGELVKHIFVAEKHHVDRLSNRPITDTGSVSSDNVERLFQFGWRSRKDLREFVRSASSWRLGCSAGIQYCEQSCERDSQETYRPRPHA